MLYTFVNSPREHPGVCEYASEVFFYLSQLQERQSNIIKGLSMNLMFVNYLLPVSIYYAKSCMIK